RGRRRPDPGDIRRAGSVDPHPRRSHGAPARPVHHRARRAVGEGAGTADRLRASRAGERRAAADRREPPGRSGAVRQHDPGRRVAEVDPACPACRRRPCHRRHLAFEHRPRARLRRIRPAAPGDPRGQPEPPAGFEKHVLETRAAVMVTENLDAEAERYGSTVEVGEMAKSVLFVPLVAGGKATGVISLQNIDREHAFTDSDQQLLETLARSLSVALENARLMHETRQRVAELATVNSVGQALAEQLELDALIGLVGERVRETFEAEIAYVALHDEASGHIDFVYYSEAGERRPEPSIE